MESPTQRYYADWIFQTISTFVYYILIFVVAFLYIGLCFYVAGMVKSLQITLEEINADSKNVFFDGIFIHNEIFK